MCVFVNPCPPVDWRSSVYAYGTGVIKGEDLNSIRIPVKLDPLSNLQLPCYSSLTEARGPGNMNSLKLLVSQFIQDEDGQGITEYFACLAFLALLIAMVFALENGTLFSALNTAFTNMAGEINRLIAGSSEPTI